MAFIFAEKPKKFDPNEFSYIIIKSKSTFLCDTTQTRIFFKAEELSLSSSDKTALLYIGQLENRPLYALEKPDFISFDKVYQHARELMDLLSPAELTAFYRAAYLLNWDSASQFCGCCGNATALSEIEFVKVCQRCHHSCFPQYSSAINVLVIRNYELLLGRSPQFKPGMYSPLAGFIESGETAVDAVHRELWEEAKIKVKNVRYFGSGPWPFPNTLLCGFIADYAEGELTPNLKEIEDARWFHYTRLPIPPVQASISYQLIQEGIKICRERETKDTHKPGSKDETATTIPLSFKPVPPTAISGSGSNSGSSSASIPHNSPHGFGLLKLLPRWLNRKKPVLHAALAAQKLSSKLIPSVPKKGGDNQQLTAAKVPVLRNTSTPSLTWLFRRKLPLYAGLGLGVGATLMLTSRKPTKK